MGKGGSFGGDFVETDEKDKERSGEKNRAKKALTDEEPAGDHEQDTGDLEGDGEMISQTRCDESGEIGISARDFGKEIEVDADPATAILPHKEQVW